MLMLIPVVHVRIIIFVAAMNCKIFLTTKSFLINGILGACIINYRVYFGGGGGGGGTPERYFCYNKYYSIIWSCSP